jgi:hypothetical protein
LRGDTWKKESVLPLHRDLDVTAVAAGKLDEGNSLGVAALTAQGDLFVLFREDSTFRTLASITAAQGCRGSAVALQDLDGDGRREIIASFAGEPSRAAPEACRSVGRLGIWAIP